MKPNEKWIHSKDGKNLNDVDLFDSYYFKSKILQAELQKRFVIKNIQRNNTLENLKSSNTKSKNTIDTWAIQ